MAEEHEGHEHDHAHPHDPAQAHAQGQEPARAHGHAQTQAHTHAHARGERGHGHPHGHSHGHGPAPAREELGRGAGRGKLLFLDAPSGLSGDMIISALVDLGVPGAVVAEAVAALPVTGFHLHFGSRVRSGIVAGEFDVHVDDPQPERTYGTIRELLDRSSLSEPIKARAQATFKKLAEAEARVHRMPLDDVHFHEVGAVDAIVDVVGSAAALDHLDAELVVSPLPMGRGYVRAAHGRLPLPAPAVVECLSSFATYDAGLDFEFVTPTGAAIVAAHASRSARWPSMAPERSGWGSGTAELADRPNLLRVILGSPVGGTGEKAGEASTHVVVETNLDDATGELLAAAIEDILDAGALDVWATPATMKKGRPAWVLSAVAESAKSHVVASAMLTHTTSIGVRFHPVSRLERPRRLVDVDTPYGPIPVKVSSGPFGGVQAKPEFDACQRAARAAGVPVREVVQAALLAAMAAKGS